MEIPALLIVDVQQDFCSGGALPAPEADTIIPMVNKYIELFQKKGWLIFATKDWHEPNSRHFKEFGGKWPTHCVQNTKGAEFHSELISLSEMVILYKGIQANADGYSAFEAIDKDGKNLDTLLKLNNVTTLYVCGLVIEFCVQASVKEAIEHDYKVKILTDAVMGLNVNPHDSEKVLQELKVLGAELIKITDIK